MGSRKDQKIQIVCKSYSLKHTKYSFSKNVGGGVVFWIFSQHHLAVFRIPVGSRPFLGRIQQRQYFFLRKLIKSYVFIDLVRKKVIQKVWSSHIRIRILPTEDSRTEKYLNCICIIATLMGWLSKRKKNELKYPVAHCL